MKIKGDAYKKGTLTVALPDLCRSLFGKDKFEELLPAPIRSGNGWNLMLPPVQSASNGLQNVPLPAKKADFEGNGTLF